MKMTELQFEMIKENLRQLTSKDCFYKAKFKEIDVEAIKTQEDFEKLPFTWKGDLREAYPLGLQAVPDEEVVRIHSSSGTTGVPVIIPYTKKDVEDWAKMFARCYEMAGITALDRRHRISGRSGVPWRHDDPHGTGQYREAAPHDAGHEGYSALCDLILCTPFGGRDREEESYR